MGGKPRPASIATPPPPPVLEMFATIDEWYQVALWRFKPRCFVGRIGDFRRPRCEWYGTRESSICGMRAQQLGLPRNMEPGQLYTVAISVAVVREEDLDAK
jgi:hypothetical protein